MGVGVIVQHPYATDAKGIIDVLYILRKTLCCMLKDLPVHLLAVVGKHHLRDVSSCSYHSMKLALTVAYRGKGYLVVYLATLGQLWDSFV